MAETTDILDHKPHNIILMNAVSQVITAENREGETTKRLTSKGQNPDIVVTVNGVEVPFLAAFEETLNRFFKDEDQRARDKAIEMLNRTGLGDMIQSLSEIRHEFTERLKKLGYTVEMREEDWQW